MTAKRIIMTAVLSFAVCSAYGETLEHTGDWSQVHDYLKARLHLKHCITNDYSVILAYLELRNTCPPSGTLKVNLPLSIINDISFVVKDSDDNSVKAKPLFCSTIASTNAINLVLPQDCTMRFCISQNGGGVFADKALLYLTPGKGWYFKHDDKKAYKLSATVKVPKWEDFNNRHWHGTLKLPEVEIPVPEKTRRAQQTPAGDVLKAAPEK